MTAERWARIKEIFSEALETPEAERAAYLDSACAGDAELRAEVERLLADHASGTLPSPAAAVLNQIPALAPGDMLAQYRGDAKLGEGGMGVVYRAYDTRLERPVALKLLLPDPDRQQRLLREARAASALNHSNIVTIHEIGTARGVDFIAMEFVEGRPLSKLIPAKGLPVETALDYAIQIADALAHAHAAGVVHRDLKPANIMVTAEGRVKLLDFGLARRRPAAESATASLTVPGAITGTPAYMSPEQAEGRKTDHRSDIFSFGVVLYEMLTGRKAFAGETTLALLAAILHEEPTPLRQIAPAVPRELERLVALCLKKDPARRLAHAEDLRLQLEMFREELGTGTLAPSPPRPAGRRGRWLLAAAGALIGAVLLFAAVGRWVNPRAESTRAPEMTRLTTDLGLTFQPAISPDGKLLAYSSDRGGQANLDIWVQQVAGGNPIKVTKDPADDTEPSFSPDGSQVAFHSKREGGGVYVVPSLGGVPRLVAARGRNPRFSPDGAHIAFWTSASLTRATPESPLGSIWIVPAAGGPPRRLRPDFVWAGYPVWTGDGRFLVFAGGPKVTSALEWWVTPLDNGPAVNTGTLPVFREGFLMVLNQVPGMVPEGWYLDSVLYSSGLAFQGGAASLWRTPISTSSWRVAGRPERLTFGAGTDENPSVSAGGRVVFANTSLRVNVWEMALEASSGRVSGEMRPLTRDGGVHIDPTLSPDGGHLAFVVGPRDRGRIRILDRRTGQESPVSAGTPSQLYPTFSPDGSNVLFKGAAPGKEPLFVVPVRGGVAEKACDHCGYAPAWTPDGTKVAYDYGLPRFVGLLDVATGVTKEFLKHSRHGVIQAQFSPRGDWIAFALVDRPGRTRLMVARVDGDSAAPEADWIPLTDGTGFDVRPRWSPDGNLLYFTSDRDGFRCIYAQRLDPATKRPLGTLLHVRHFHDPQRLLADIPDLSLSVAKDRMIFNLAEKTGNIWMFQLPEGR